MTSPFLSDLVIEFEGQSNCLFSAEMRDLIFTGEE